MQNKKVIKKFAKIRTRNKLNFSKAEDVTELGDEGFSVDLSQSILLKEASINSPQFFGNRNVT